MTMTNEQVYEKIVELNYCMAQLSATMRPLREELVNLSRQFTAFSKEKDRLERQLVVCKVIPEGQGKRIVTYVPRTPEELLTDHLSSMQATQLEDIMRLIKDRLEKGGKET